MCGAASDVEGAVSYFTWDPRPHGWFKSMGGYKFGPLPKGEPAAEATWPPHKLEGDQNRAALARDVRARRHLTATEICGKNG